MDTSTSGGSAAGGSSQVRVIVRVRPLLPHESAAAAAASNAEPCVQVTTCDGAPAVLLRDETTDSFGKDTPGETLLTFDGVYESSVGQAELFEREVLPHVSARVFAGQTATLFAYGMTGTGKSHTMNGTTSDPGLIPRTVQHLFDAITERVAADEQEWATTSVHFSFFELYNEKIRDLCVKPPAPTRTLCDRGSSNTEAPKDPSSDLPVREDAHGKVFVANLSETRVDSYAAFAAAYAIGMKHRKIAATKLNAHSSRAHTMILLKVEYRTKRAPFKRVTGRIQLLDLAGNEDNRFSGNTASKARMAESSKINNSLFVLGKVINGLNAGETRIAYRDSKLTRLLQDSLGGGNYAMMVCNISPNPAHMAWTQRTLSFASKSRQVVNVVEKNVVEQQAVFASAASLDADAKSDLKSKLDAWRRDNGRPVSAAVFAASSGTAGSKAKRIAVGGVTAQTASTSAKMDPAVLAKLNSLTNDVNSMKAAMVLQQRQHAQQLRPSSAAAASASVHHPSSQHASSSSLVPLTPLSSAHLARSSVEKAKVWEKNAQWEKALDEYREAARIRPGNEKLMLKIKQVEAKVERQANGGGGQSSPSAPTAGTKHARDQVPLTAFQQAMKQRKLATGSKTIPEEDESEVEETESDEEDEASDEEMSASESEASDYDPMDEEEDEDAVWMRRAKTRGTRATRSNPSSKEASPTTSPAPVSLLRGIANSKTLAAAVSPVAMPALKTTSALTRPSTSPNLLSKPSSTVRTPLGSLSTQQKAATSTSASSITPVLKPKLLSSSNTNTTTPPTCKPPVPMQQKVSSPATVLPSKNKENVLPAPVQVAAPTSKPAAVKKAAKPAATLTATLPPPIAVAAPLSGPGLLLSSLVSGRDNLLRLLNSGTLKDLMELQTIGKKRAQLILSKREEMGAYVTLADLSHIGLSDTQVEQFTQRNLMSTVWNSAMVE